MGPVAIRSDGRQGWQAGDRGDGCAWLSRPWPKQTHVVRARWAMVFVVLTVVPWCHDCSSPLWRVGMDSGGQGLTPGTSRPATHLPLGARPGPLLSATSSCGFDPKAGRMRSRRGLEWEVAEKSSTPAPRGRGPGGTVNGGTSLEHRREANGDALVGWRRCPRPGVLNKQRCCDTIPESAADRITSRQRALTVRTGYVSSPSPCG